MKSSNLKGFTLVELMIAMFIGVILLLGLVSLFNTTSTLNKAQSGLALLQENGRYAISKIKQDIEQAGKRHCVSVKLPSADGTNWNQGYELSVWEATRDANFTNGFPLLADVLLDNVEADPDQLGDTPPANVYPIDARYFMQGHECGDSVCEPEASTSTIGSDYLTTFRSIGPNDGQQAAETDILTVRYLTGGLPITGIRRPSVDPTVSRDEINFSGTATATAGNILVADCNESYVDSGNWGAGVVTLANPLPVQVGDGVNARVYSIEEDLQNITYFVGIDTDPSEPGRLISSLYRSVNGNAQLIVEGVERLDFFYLAQLQTGQIARLTADEVQAVSGGGDLDGDGAVDDSNGCIEPSLSKSNLGFQTSNDEGCLWRSIYAVEVHMLLNTVNDSAGETDETFLYSPDGDMRQNPEAGLPSGLDGERMYRREFTAIIPIRSYTL